MTVVPPRLSALMWLTISTPRSGVELEQWGDVVDVDGRAEYGAKWIAKRPPEDTPPEQYEYAFTLHVVPYLGDLEIADVKEGRVRRGGSSSPTNRSAKPAGRRRTESFARS